MLYHLFSFTREKRLLYINVKKSQHIVQQIDMKFVMFIKT